MAMTAKPGAQDPNLAVEGGFPSLSGAVEWLNSPPLTREGLKGKVVLIDFWTYSCINCLRAIPYVRAWAEKYKDHGLVVIGVHTPEFAFERKVSNVRAAVADLKIGYPVAVDNEYNIWRAFDNQYWPAHYFIDAQGRMRYHHFGEGEYDQSERVIQQLLAEAGDAGYSPALVSVTASGAEAAPEQRRQIAGDLYRLQSRGQLRLARRHRRRRKPRLRVGAAQLNQWTLSGDWTVGAENAALNKPDGRIAYRFHARDLHLVLGPRPTAGRSGFASPSMVRPPVRITAPTSTPMAAAYGRRAASVSAHPPKWRFQQVTRVLTVRGAAAEREHRVRAVEEAGDDVMLDVAERRLAVRGENLPDRAPGALLDHQVAVHERQPEPVGEHPAHRGLARAHEADDDDHACSRRAATARSASA